MDSSHDYINLNRLTNRLEKAAALDLHAADATLVNNLLAVRAHDLAWRPLLNVQILCRRRSLANPSLRVLRMAPSLVPAMSMTVHAAASLISPADSMLLVKSSASITR